MQLALDMVQSTNAAPSLAMRGMKRSQVKKMLGEKAFTTVYQPIRNLHSKRIVGYECLTRFASEPYRSPDLWFGDAAEVGLGIELEIQTFKSALRQCAALPSDGFLALNVSPDVVVSGWITKLLKVVDPRRIILELTEHAPVDDYQALQGILSPLRECGVRVAIDDVGAGYANLQHILTLQPDLIKLDVSLVRDVDICPSRAALLVGLINFARTFNSEVLAEGVETVSQLDALQRLGVDLVQGYLVGRPACAEVYSEANDR